MEVRMGFEGMDVDDVRRRAAHLNELGSELAIIQRSLKNIFDLGSTWVGAGSEHARNELNSKIIPALMTIRRFIEDAGQEMSINADQQEAASNAS
jgi:hypothetical protein